MYSRSQESPGLHLHSGFHKVQRLEHQGRSESTKRSTGEGHKDTVARAVGGGHLAGI